MQPEEIKHLIQAGLEDATILLDGDGSHFNATIISRAFADKTRIEKQKLVYNTIRQQLDDGTIHAISIKTFTPEEWDNQEAR